MNPSDPRESLSDAGATHHRQILAAAFREADRRQRRRIVRRGFVSVCVAGLIVTSVVILRPRTRPVALMLKNGSATDPAITSQPTVSEPTTQEHLRWEVINDDQLLAALSEAGTPAGIIRLNGRTEIIPQ